MHVSEFPSCSITRSLVVFRRQSLPVRRSSSPFRLTVGGPARGPVCRRGESSVTRGACRPTTVVPGLLPSRPLARWAPAFVFGVLREPPLIPVRPPVPEAHVGRRRTLSLEPTEALFREPTLSPWKFTFILLVTFWGVYESSPTGMTLLGLTLLVNGLKALPLPKSLLLTWIFRRPIRELSF